MKFKPYRSLEELRSTKLQTGDCVTIGDGKQYTLVTLGLKYARLQAVDSGHTLGLVKLTDIRKVDDATPESPLDELTRGEPCGVYTPLKVGASRGK